MNRSCIDIDAMIAEACERNLGQYGRWPEGLAPHARFFGKCPVCREAFTAVRGLTLAATYNIGGCRCGECGALLNLRVEGDPLSELATLIAEEVPNAS